jgi:SAM-dependent methyltransferase
MTDTTNVALRDRAHSDSKLATLYDESFYESYVATSIESARIYLKFLWQFFQPTSALDVGCGRGTWLKACHELGSKTLLGFDGSWNSQSSMIDPDINFQSIDLNKPFSVSDKVDIAITLEVAEHLEPSSASQFVKCLTDASNVVLFSAAYTKQGGTNHINEKPHSYWALLFSEHDFVPFDMFRPQFWDNEDVCFWYRQNAFLYVKKDSAPYWKIKTHGINEISNIGFMNCIHPELYGQTFEKHIVDLQTQKSFKNHIADLMPSLWRALRRRLSNFQSWVMCVSATSGFSK